MNKFTFKDYVKNNPQFMVAIIVTGILLAITIGFSIPYVTGESLNSWTTTEKETKDAGWFMIFFMSLVFISSVVLTVSNYIKTKKRVIDTHNKINK